MKKIFLFHLLLVCPVIFLIWYIVFPNYLWLPLIPQHYYKLNFLST